MSLDKVLTLETMLLERSVSQSKCQLENKPVDVPINVVLDEASQTTVLQDSVQRVIPVDDKRNDERDELETLHGLGAKSAGRYEMNPFGSSEYEKKCCSMMSQMPNKCRCDALKEMMMKECRSPYSSQERTMCKPMMMEKMMNIPNTCNQDWEKCEYEMILV
ncbi:hypothetical protein QQ045_000736 [Rhodiola kirilowii]